MLNKTLALLLIFSLAFNIAFVGIWAYVRWLPGAPPPEAPGPEPGPPPEAGPAAGVPGPGMPWTSLGLRPDQEEKLRSIWTDYQQEMRTLGEQAGEHRSKLFALLEAENLDTEAIRAEQDAIDQAQQEMSRLTLEQLRSVHGVLTPEQRHKWLQTMRAHGERLRGRFGGPGRGRDGAPMGPGLRGMRSPEGPRGGLRGRWGRPTGRPGPGQLRQEAIPERRQEDEAQ
jgi:Spy/CpxP family protein refolding chaperone